MKALCAQLRDRDRAPGLDRIQANVEALDEILARHFVSPHVVVGEFWASSPAGARPSRRPKARTTSSSRERATRRSGGRCAPVPDSNDAARRTGAITARRCSRPRSADLLARPGERCR